MSASMTETSTNHTIKQIKQLDWVAYVRKTINPDATHLIEAELGAFWLDTQGCELENLGCTIKGIDKHSDYGIRIFVDIP